MRQPLSRMAWGVLSQSLNSVGNMVLAFWVARSSSPEDFGAWSIGYAVLMVGIQVSRALASTPLLLQDSTSASWLAPASVALAGAVGVVLGVLLAGAGLIFGTISGALFAFAMVLPVILVQDSVRHSAFARSRPSIAVGMDGLWFVLQVAASWALVGGTNRSPAISLTLVWGAAAAASALLGMLLVKHTLAMRDIGRFRSTTAGISKSSLPTPRSPRVAANPFQSCWLR